MLDISVAVALFDNDSVAVMVSTAIAIPDHFTFPNDVAVSVTVTDGYTHRTDTHSNFSSKHWHRCPDKYGDRGYYKQTSLHKNISCLSDSAHIDNLGETLMFRSDLLIVRKPAISSSGPSRTIGLVCFAEDFSATLEVSGG